MHDLLSWAQRGRLGEWLPCTPPPTSGSGQAQTDTAVWSRTWKAEVRQLSDAPSVHGWARSLACCPPSEVQLRPPSPGTYPGFLREQLLPWDTGVRAGPRRGCGKGRESWSCRSRPPALAATAQPGLPPNTPCAAMVTGTCTRPDARGTRWWCELARAPWVPAGEGVVPHLGWPGALEAGKWPRTEGCP